MGASKTADVHAHIDALHQGARIDVGMHMVASNAAALHEHASGPKGGDKLALLVLGMSLGAVGQPRLARLQVWAVTLLPFSKAIAMRVFRRSSASKQCTGAGLPDAVFESLNRGLAHATFQLVALQ